MPQLRMTASVGQHRLLLFRQRLVRLHRLDRRRRQRLGPRFLLQPAVVRPPRNAQRRQRPPRRPAAPLPRLFHFFMHALLQRRRQLPVVLYPESPFFSSRFSAVISATTSLSRRSSSACRSSRALGRLVASSKILLADDCNCFFQP